MSQGSRTVIDVTYDDPRTGQKVRERRVQEIPYEELESIRNKELAVVSERDAVRYKEDDRGRDVHDNDDGPVEYTVRRTTRERGDRGDRYSNARSRRDYDDRDYYAAPPRRSSAYDDRRSRRQAQSAYSDSDSESSRERRRRRRHRRARSEKASSEVSSGQGRLWFSGKDRKDATFMEKHFDSSYDGIIAGVAGAAIGAITARQFAGQEKRGLKIIGGAALGAAAINSAENHYRLFTEEREDGHIMDPLKLAAGAAKNM